MANLICITPPGDLTYASLPSPAFGEWVLLSSDLKVNGESLDVANNSRFMIFDSGTSNMILPQADTEVGIPDANKEI